MKKRSGPLKRKVSRTNRNDAETAVISCHQNWFCGFFTSSARLYCTTPTCTTSNPGLRVGWYAQNGTRCAWSVRNLSNASLTKRERRLSSSKTASSLTSRPTELSTLFAISGPEGIILIDIHTRIIGRWKAGSHRVVQNRERREGGSVAGRDRGVIRPEIKAGVVARTRCIVLRLFEADSLLWRSERRACGILAVL